MRELRAVGLLALAFISIAAAAMCQPLTILDVPFIAQSELLCGGAAAAMVMRYWGERGIDAESFRPLLDKNAGGIRTAVLAGDLRARRWNAVESVGTVNALTHEIQQRHPVIVLLEDRPGTFHYVVVVARSADGVVFHDPARNPFRVAGAVDFDRRWAAAGRWMLVVTPAASETPVQPLPSAVADPPEPAGVPEPTTCDALVAEGVRQASSNDLVDAERSLVSALSCPGAAAFRELAGLRLLERRWPEVIDLADTAVRRDPSDAYAWKLLATARFVGDDTAGALDAWNRADEPRIDLIRLDGLTRTRYAVVQQLIGLKTGGLLTSGTLGRARRRLGELPSGVGALDFEPVPSGRVEVRGRIAERPLVPTGVFDIGVLALATAVTREFVASVSSPTGGGERIAVDWRFWPDRPLYQVSYAAPGFGPGIWTFVASRETQPYSTFFSKTVHESVRFDVADWSTRSVRWQFGGGGDRWNGERTLAMATAGIRLVTPGDRIDTRIVTRSWFGDRRLFQSAQALLMARSRARQQGFVVFGGGGISVVSASAPADLWFAGDTGRARPLMLRAHPVLGDGERFQTERLGRLVGNGSAEVQRWWKAGPGRIAAAVFVDSARTGHRVSGPPIDDVDIGIGFRGGYPGRAGSLGVNLARGLRDGNTALSVVYTP